MEIKATNIQRCDGKLVGGIARHRASYTVLDLQRVGRADGGSPAWELRLQGPVGRSVLRSKRRILDGQLAGGLLPTGQSVGKLHSLYNLAIWLDLWKLNWSFFHLYPRTLLFALLLRFDLDGPLHQDDASTGPLLSCMLSLTTPLLGF